MIFNMTLLGWLMRLMVLPSNMVFHALTFPRDLANVNAWKTMFDLYIIKPEDHWSYIAHLRAEDMLN